MKISIFYNFWKSYYFFPKPTPCICMHSVKRQQRRRSCNFIIFGPEKGIKILISIKRKIRDINLMMIYLIFYQNCNFLATHVDARSWNGDLLLSSVDISRCAASWQTRFWKLKLISNILVNLRNFYPNMVVFWLELLIFFEFDSEYKLENIHFLKFLKILLFFSLTHTVHLHA